MGLFAAKRAQTQLDIDLHGKRISCVLKRSSRRRTLALRVDDRGLTVHAPFRVADRQIFAFLEAKSGWVLAKLAEVEATRPRQPQWQSGMPIRYLGAPILLDISPAVDAPILDAGTLTAPAHDTESEVIRWYKNRAMVHFTDRARVFAQRAGLPMPKVRISNARTRWGSCNSRGVIRLSWRLMKATPMEIDYVIAHEIAHMREMNHSPRFWAIVETLFPQYHEARRALRAAQSSYLAF